MSADTSSIIGKVLVVDDEANARQTLCMLLEESNFEVRQAADGLKALGILKGDWQPDIVLTDLRMPLMDGFELLRQIKGLPGQEHTACVVMTAFASVESAVEVMKQGADDYLTKPLNFDAVEIVLGRVMERLKMRRELHTLREEVSNNTRKKRAIIGSSPVMKELYAMIDQVAPARATVLVQGESGTGKELVARRLHERSNRADAPFIAIHCGALPESLLESELFGHEKGSFTGAQGLRKGRFEQAHGGTLFLDEIGDISHHIQLKLLRVLQERSFERVGGNRPVDVDVRIIAATHKNLKDLIASGEFREDLFYRLNVIQIKTPSLRERRDDIPLLAQYLTTRHARDNAKTIDEISSDAMTILQGYHWPGNVRELENVMERAVVLANQGIIEPKHLPRELGESDASMHDLTVSGEIKIPGATLEQLEKVAILKTYEQCQGNSLQTAKLLGISQRKVQYRLRQYREQGESLELSSS